jgi:2-dehydropantoate 2-reductase
MVVLASLAAVRTVSPRPPRVLIFGTGALACAMGARLARFGHAAVTLAGSWSAALTAIASHGIVVDEASGVWSAKVHVAPPDGPFGPADIVLVLVKSHRTAAVARTAARALLPSSLVVTLQNGLGNREALEAAAGPGTVSVGVSSLAATILGPGEVRVVPGRIILGAPASASPAVAASLPRLLELLAASRIEAEISPEIERILWARLAVQCAINPLSALTGRAIGNLLETPEPCETLLRAAREVGAVATARGIDLGGDPATLAVEAAESSPAARSTMQHDLERGALTEVDAQSGAIVEEGRRRGVATPANEYLWRRVREREGRPVLLSRLPGRS